jgi:methanogenic corrinoid protein MtbC1
MCYINLIMSFGQKLREIRKERGLRQQDVADALHLAQTTIANYEQGTRFPDIPTFHRLADFFGVTMDDLLEHPEKSPGEAVSPTAGEVPLELNPQAKRYLRYLLEFLPAKAESFLREEMKDGMSLADVYLETLQPALYEVGRLWEIGEIDVSREHYCSEATQEIMSRIFTPQKKSQKKRSFLGLSVTGELHRIGIRMVSHLLAQDGWKSVFLGTHLPTSSILKASRDHEADVLGISASMPYHINGVENLISLVQKSELIKPMKIIVGGLAFNREPDAWKDVGADGYASNAAEAVSAVNRLAGNGR